MSDSFLRILAAIKDMWLQCSEVEKFYYNNITEMPYFFQFSFQVIYIYDYEVIAKVSLSAPPEVPP
jgi:hypothetical protein